MFNKIELFPENFDETLQTQDEKIAYLVLSQLHFYKLEKISFKTLPVFKMISAIGIKKDLKLLSAIRKLYQQGLIHLCEQLNQENLPATHEDSLDFLYSSLCYLPFWEWHHDESPLIKIPQFINHQWELVEFQITTIELTPKTGFASLWIKEADRAFAYGLHSTQENIEPILIFSGTTYPAGAGCLTHIKNDLQAFQSAGFDLFQSGKARILQWLNNLNHKKTRVMGISLGGGMTLIMATQMPESVSLGFALNPPGLHDFPKELFTEPSVRVLTQANDPVSIFGKWHKSWQLAHIHLSDEPNHNMFISHGSIFAGKPNKHYEYLDPETKNNTYAKLNLLMFKGLRSVVYISLMLPLYYIIIPSLRFVWAEKWHILCTLPFLLLGLNILPAIGLGILLGELLNWKDSSVFQAIKNLSSANYPTLFISAALILANIATYFVGLYLLPLTLHATFLLIPLIDKMLKPDDSIDLEPTQTTHTIP